MEHPFFTYPLWMLPKSLHTHYTSPDGWMHGWISSWAQRSSIPGKGRHAIGSKPSKAVKIDDASFEDTLNFKVQKQNGHLAGAIVHLKVLLSRHAAARRY